MLNSAELWDKYLRKKQTYQELADEYGCSTKTIQRRLDEYCIQFNEQFPKVANVVLDTTYFGRNFGVMCFKDSISKTLLHKQFVRYETKALYFEGVTAIRTKALIFNQLFVMVAKDCFIYLTISLFKCANVIR